MDNDNIFNSVNNVPLNIESDFINFEKNQREFLHELQTKRILLDECRQELNETISKKHELERKLEIEKRKYDRDTEHMNFAINIAKTLENDKQKIKENSNLNAVQLEIANAERDALLEEVRKLQLENMKLKREVEDVNGKHKCHLVFQKDILGQQNILKTTMTQLDSSVKNLRKEHEKVHELSKKVEELSQIQLLVKYKENEKQSALKQQNQLENELIKKNAELDSLKELVKKYSIHVSVENTISEYWQNKYKELTQQLTKEMEATWQLTENLQQSSETNYKLIKNENVLMSKIKVLEEFTKEKVTKENYCQTDNRDEENEIIQDE